MVESTARPNFFIVGAPKSGTTSMHYYLSQHPQVLMSRWKEPCYLAPDFHSPVYPKSEKEYLSLFAGYNGQKRIGESTTTYLYSKEAAQRICEFSPNAKIIAMLRNPVDLVAALHAQRLKEGDENIFLLEDALAAEDDRRKGEKVPFMTRIPKEYFLYREYGRYASQLRRYYSAFGRHNVHVIIFDDFLNDAESVFADTCEFLDIDADFAPEFTVQNAAQVPRFLSLHRCFNILNPALLAIGNRMRPFVPIGILKKTWKNYNDFVKLINLKSGRPRLHDETRRSLAEFYCQEIKDLEKLLGRDLDCWHRKNGFVQPKSSARCLAGRS